MIFYFIQSLRPWFIKTLEISLHTALLIGVLLLIRPLIKRVLPSHWVYALWFIVIVRMILIDVPTLPEAASFPLQNSLAAMPGIGAL